MKKKNRIVADLRHLDLGWEFHHWMQAYREQKRKEVPDKIKKKYDSDKEIEAIARAERRMRKILEES